MNGLDLTDDDQVNAYAPSPTLARFHASSARFRGVRGPIGSGKSVGCVADLMMWIMEQEPDRRGVRRTKFACVRNTYGELKATTIPTFREWAPEPACKWKMDQPINCMIRMPVLDEEGVPDGTTIEAEFWFISLDSVRDLKKLKSLELTGVWLNEASELPWSVVEMARGRVGRFPGKKYGAPITRYGVIADTNPPDDDHWWYRLAEVERPEGYEFFAQPPAILWDGVTWQPNPSAENVKHQQLGAMYWLNQVPGATLEFVRTMLCGDYGGVQDGKPVYASYNDGIHCASEILRPDPAIPFVHLGWDWGTTPACVIGQLTPAGQLRVLDEVFTDDGVVRDLAANRVRPLLAQDYAEMQAKGWGDPSGVARESSGMTAFDTLREEQLPAIPAPTNDIGLRIDAVNYFLTRMVNGQPGFLLSPACERLRRGFRGRYKYERILTRLGSDERYHTAPAKNIYSHVHDGLQYLALGVRGAAKAATAGNRPVGRVRRRGSWVTA